MAHIHVLAGGADRSCGPGVYTTELVRRLPGLGHKITLVCHHATQDLSPWCDVRQLPVPPRTSWPLVWRASSIFRVTSLPGALRKLALDQPDVVIGTSYELTWAHGRLFPSIPLLFVPHSLVAPVETKTNPFGSPLERWLTMRTLHSLERHALRRAVRTVRFTHAGCRALQEYYGSRIARRFAVLPAPVAIPHLPAPNARCCPPRLLSVGRLVETKNLAFLIRCLDRLRTLPWSLDVVGDGEERSVLQADVCARGLADRITFHGHQEDVNRWYRAASLFVFPSRLESAGLVLLEAKSHALPALAIRPDGQRYRNVNHEMIDDGKDGFLARDEDDFAAKLAELLGRPDLLSTVGRQARDRVEQHHSWDAHAKRFDYVIARALRRSTTSRLMC